MKLQNKPLVTIAIPTFNGEKHITQAIQSATNQTYPNIEIIISDNASSDNTGGLCQQLSEKHRNVTYIKQPINQGPTANFNYLLTHASGDYFMWLGDDDWIDENYIDTCVASLENNPAATIIAGRPKYYNNETFIYSGIAMNISNSTPEKRVSKYFATVKHNGIFYGVMRTEQIKEYLLSNSMGGDLLFVAGLVFLGEVHTLEKTSVHRRRGGDSSNSKLLSRKMSLPWIDYYFPRISVAINTTKYITTSPIFSTLSLTQRYILSIKCITLATIRKTSSIIFKNHFIEQSATPRKE